MHGGGLRDHWLAGWFSQEGMRLGIGILAGITLFSAVAPLISLAMGDGGWFGGGFLF